MKSVKNGINKQNKGEKMKVKELLKELEKLNPETIVQIEDEHGNHYKAIWVMYYKGELTIGWED